MNFRFWESKSTRMLRAEQQNFEIANVKAAINLIESTYATQDIWKNMVDPDEAIGDGWMSLTLSDKKFKFTAEQLTAIRNKSRQLAATNGAAIAALEYRCNHIVGERGMSYQLVPSGGDDTEALQNKINEAMVMWDFFIEENRWGRREKELWLRSDRDGEAFLRFFASARNQHGEINTSVPGVRFVEPAQLKARNTDISLGIEFSEDDAEVPVRYHIEESPVPAEEVYRFKHTTDMNIARGVPILYPVFKNLDRIDKLMHNTSVVAQVQSAIALLRKHTGASGGAVRKLLDATSENTTGSTPKNTAGAPRQMRLRAGTIIDAPAGTEYEVPISKVALEKFSMVAMHDLYMVASTLKVPVFALLSYYDGTTNTLDMLTEPCQSAYRSYQGDYIDEIASPVFKRVMQESFSEEEWIKMKLVVKGPSGIVTDILADARTREVEIRNGVLSQQTWCAEKGRDFYLEKQNRSEAMSNALPEEKFPWTVLQGQNAREQDTPDGVTSKDGTLKTDGNKNSNPKQGE